MPSEIAENPSEAASPRSRPSRSWLAALYPAVWRWHFWAGLLITPVLILLALTGGLYVFQKELRQATRPAWYRVDPPPGAAKQSYAARVAAAKAALPDGWEFDAFNESPDPRAADELVFETDDGPQHIHRFVYVDPYRARVLGFYDFERSFFGTVIRLHTQLLAGTAGRLILEVATCWGIVSLLTGLLLWWPRGKEKLWGVWLPRLRRGARIALRDLHTLPGLYLAAAAFAIMVTGLLYTPVWGKAAFAGLFFGGQLPPAYVSPPKSTPLPEGATPAGIDAVVAEARRHYPFPEFRLQAPHAPGASWVLYGPTQTGDLDDGVVYVDATTGRTLATIDYPSLKPGAKVALMFYSIHTGSVFGTPTKVLAVIACLVIVAMSVTGVWMWWRRRPAGRFGAPRKTAGEAVPRAAVAAIIVLAIVFPLVGASLLALWLAEFGLRLVRRRPARAV
ncbi:MAG TPA: PepSY-associated TM helix domain-containing protein [Opitutaceae bacterium]